MSDAFGVWAWRPIPGGSIAVNEVGEPVSNGRVATVPYKSGFEERTRQRAHLIAAAPELYRALLRAGRKLEAYVGVCNGDKELTDSIIPMVNEALKKARGEE